MNADLHHRLGDALGRDHDLALELQALGEELVEYGKRRRSMSERMMSSLGGKSTLDTPGDIERVPDGINPKLRAVTA